MRSPAPRRHRPYHLQRGRGRRGLAEIVPGPGADHCPTSTTNTDSRWEPSRPGFEDCDSTRATFAEEDQIKAVAREAEEPRRPHPRRRPIPAHWTRTSWREHRAPVPEALVDPRSRDPVPGGGRLHRRGISVKHSHVPSMVDSSACSPGGVVAPCTSGSPRLGRRRQGSSEVSPGFRHPADEGHRVAPFSLLTHRRPGGKRPRQAARLLESSGYASAGPRPHRLPLLWTAEVDVIDVATHAPAALEAENLPIQVAVMGVW